MSKRTAQSTQPPNPQPVESPPQPPIDLKALTPQQRTRLDKAVMTLVEYLVAASAKTG